ncbi:MAG: hypothetical protein K2X77_05535 [Candidatus Obscuribacterales bacterium]|jgi:hypothetical protein|nr:hypothetical protein [Candidatus Obscuribacterales bacterium]
MKSTFVTVLLAALVVSASSPVLAQSKSCPSGEHYDTKQQKCVKHGD